MKKLLNSKIQKIKETHNGFLFDLHIKNQKNFLIILPKFGFFISEKNYELIELSELGKQTRRHLIGSKIIDVRQHEFDRIIEIETTNHILIVEFFGDGNFILTQKPNKKIIIALSMRSWRHRTIKPNLEYVHPPSYFNPFKMSLEQLTNHLQNKEFSLVLIKDFGFGNEITEDICRKLMIDKNEKISNRIPEFYEFLNNINSWFKDFSNLNEIIKDEYEKELELIRNKPYDERRQKYFGIKSKQLEKLHELKEEREKYQTYINGMNEKVDYFYDILTKFWKLKDNKEKHEEIAKKLNLEFVPKKSIIVINDIPVDFRYTINENIQKYYSEIKKIKKKITGVNKAIEELDVNVSIKPIINQQKPVDQKQWYENFRWFISSDNFLIIGGKDAKSNEQLIRKHMKENDLVFHNDITGSPFVLIKNPEKLNIPEQTISEVAQFCASYSKAWKIGIQTADVYYIKPIQMKKEGGLPTGSFMIYGERGWIRRVELKIAVGIKDDKVIYGPESAIKKQTKNYVLIVPGNENYNEVMKKRFENMFDKVKKEIPYSMCRIVRFIDF